MTTETRTASDAELLWRTVGANPEDALARLVLADELDAGGNYVHAALHRCIATDGDPERVEQLAAACEAAGDRQRADHIYSEERTLILGAMWRGGPKCKKCGGTGKPPDAWLDEDHLAVDNCLACAGTGDAGGLMRRTFYGDEDATPETWRNPVDFKWGFPWRVHANLEECVMSSEGVCIPSPWLRDVLEDHPGVQRVVLTDREPALCSFDGREAWGGGWIWSHSVLINTPIGLPLCIHDHLRGAARDGGWKVYGTAFEAVDDLARAVAVWGRTAGGLA